jgi:hypothetical protein
VGRMVRPSLRVLMKVIMTRSNGELGSSFPAFVTIVEGSFVAMMAVSDDELLFEHGLLNGGDALRIGKDPEAVDDAVFITKFRDGSGGGFGFRESGVNAALRIGVKHEELSSVNLRVPKKLEAVGFRAG